MGKHGKPPVEAALGRQVAISQSRIAATLNHPRLISEFIDQACGNFLGTTLQKLRLIRLGRGGQFQNPLPWGKIPLA
jgi:hypothetical protein